MAGSFVEHINLLASKLPIIEESNEIFDAGVIPVLHEIAQLDLEEAIMDLKKGNYLGNRKLDINLILNMLDVDEELLERNPDLAETIWTDVNKAVHYDRAFITFVDGVEIELPFMFDGSPVTITTHGDLLAQLARLDYVYAKAQIDSIYQLTVGNSTDYTVTIDAIPYTFTSDVVATRENIIAGIANMLNSESIPITALVTDNGTKINLVAEVPGNPFYATVSSNMAINTVQANVIEGPLETEFLAKLENTLAANFAEPVVGEIVRIYDLIGFNSNLERIKLNAVSGSYITQAPIYYWAKTTSAFQTLSMRANDIIKLGNEIDKIILLAQSIEEVIEIQKRIPQLVDTYDENGNPNGDETIYNNLSELIDVHSKLVEIVTLYNDLKAGGTNYIQSIGQDLQGSNTIGVVATDLQLGVDSNINITGSNIDSVITVSDNIVNVNTVVPAIPNIDLVVDSIIPNLPEILLADDNAIIATNKALEATNAAAIATAKNNEIKNVSVGSTITGAAGTNASVVYNPANGKFTFVVPQGVKGDKGDAFQVNAVGLFGNRDLYDTRPQGFSFLSLDTSLIYFKMSNISGEWSSGAPFGKGETGATGATGNGIAAITFTSSSLGGLAGQSGATDTYTITYTDATTDPFVVYNGIDSEVQSVAGRIGDVVLTESDITDLDKYTKAEVEQKIVELAPSEIDDIQTTITNTWSASKINSELATKQDTLVSGVNIKTINGQSVLGNGDFELQAGATVVETVIAPNETKTVYTDNTVTVGGLNVSIMEEDLSTSETTNIMKYNTSSVIDMYSYDFGFNDTITITTDTATLSNLVWNVEQVNMTIYEKNGIGKASIISINGNIATIKILHGFSKNVLSGGEWAVYAFSLDNGKIELSSSSENNLLKNIEKLDTGLNMNLYSTNDNIGSYVDSFGNLHIIAYNQSTRKLNYITNKTGVFTVEENIANSAISFLPVSFSQHRAGIHVDDFENITVCFLNKIASNSYVLKVIHKKVGGNWEVDINFPTVGLTSSHRPTNFIIKTINGKTTIFYQQRVFTKVDGTSWGDTTIDCRSIISSFIENGDGTYDFLSFDSDNHSFAITYYNGRGTFTTYNITNYFIYISSEVTNVGMYMFKDNYDRHILAVGSNGIVVHIKESYVGSFRSNRSSTSMYLTTSNYPNAVVHNTTFSSVEKAYFIPNSDGTITILIKQTGNSGVFAMSKYKNGVVEPFVLIDPYYNSYQTYLKNAFVIPSAHNSYAAIGSDNGNYFTLNAHGSCIYISGEIYKGLENREPTHIIKTYQPSHIYKNRGISINRSYFIDSSGFTHMLYQSLPSNDTYYQTHYVTNKSGEFITDFNIFSTSTSVSDGYSTILSINNLNEPCVVCGNGKIYKKVNNLTWTLVYNRGSSLNIYAHGTNHFLCTNINGKDRFEFFIADGNNIKLAIVDDSVMVSKLVYASPMNTYPYITNSCIYRDTDTNIVYGAVSYSDVVGKIFTYNIDTEITNSANFVGNGYSAIFENPKIVKTQNGDIILFHLGKYSTSSYYWFYFSRINTDCTYQQRLLSFTQGDLSNSMTSLSASQGDKVILGYCSNETTNDFSYVELDSKKLIDNNILDISYQDTIDMACSSISMQSQGTVAEYNKTTDSIEGFISGNFDSVTGATVLFFFNRGVNLKKYVTNKFVNVITAPIFTKYWVDVIGASITYFDKEEKFYMSYSYDANEFFVYNRDTSTERTIVTSKSAVHGGIDGDWYYNNSDVFSTENWVTATSLDDALESAFAVSSNVMSIYDFYGIVLEPNEWLYFQFSFRTDNEKVSPRLENLSVFYNSLSKWVHKTQEYTISADSIESVYITNNSNETKHIKVVHNG